VSGANRGSDKDCNWVEDEIQEQETSENKVVVHRQEGWQVICLP